MLAFSQYPYLSIYRSLTLENSLKAISNKTKYENEEIIVEAL